MDEPLPVAGYFRVSQARDDMKAPELYRDDIERYCSYRNLTVGEVFSDIDFSGYRGAKPRPALEELKLRRYEFSAVVIPKLSRFGRSVKDLVNLFDLFDRDGIALHFLDMNLDTSTSQGRLLRHIMAAFAEYESDVKSDYAKATHHMLAREGRPHGPLPPYGYRYVGSGVSRTYAIDEPAAAIIRGLFEGSLAGGSFTKLARDLNERGLRGPQGGEWTRQRVKTLLDNPAYAAFRIHEGGEYAGKWPPIVSRQLFDEVKQVRYERRTTYVNPSGRRSHLLSGLLVCGVCDRNLHYARFGTTRANCYRCVTGISQRIICIGGQILADRADKLVADAFFDSLELVGDATGRDAAWAEADVVARQKRLSEAIAKVTLLPRPPGNRHGRGMPIGRSVRILWQPAWSQKVFGYVGATSTLSPRDTRIASSHGKTWAEWRRARLLPK